MAKSKKPRKKRNPVKTMNTHLTPLELVARRFIPARDISMIDTAKIRASSALTMLTQGSATIETMNVVTEMYNISRKLMLMGFGSEHSSIIVDARVAVGSIIDRAHKLNKLGVNGFELKALNDLIDLHTAQLNLVNCGELQKAVDEVQKDFKNGKSERLAKPKILSTKP